MTVDSILSLSCSMQAKKGVYALLLGSGISRSSGIPTGWEITTDLIKKIAALNGEMDIENPEQWYFNKYDKQPDYSELLDHLAKTPSERNQLLKDYFELAEENDDQSYKKPTKAHKAIAQMIKEGYIRVVITTNFDRLLEMALTEVGIVSDVISTSNQLEGALPLIHSKCTVIKINGDYMDTRIKNTVAELSEYDDNMNSYLNRVFDDFGLIICGWSGEWDIALKENIFRCKSNRFTTYWLKKGILTDGAQRVIDCKHAQVIDIEGADDFFGKLHDNLLSLNDLSTRQNPLSIDVACATLKRLLPDTKNIIRINDLIMDECREIATQIQKLEWNEVPANESIKLRIEQLENICRPIIFLSALGCYWGENKYNSIWSEMFTQLNNIDCPSSYVVWKNIINYPSLLVMYTIIMACIKSEHYELLYRILNDVKNNKNNLYREPKAISMKIYPEAVIERSICNDALSNGEKKYVPVSERMYEILREPIFQLINDEDAYNNLFDKAEYFYAANHWYNEAINENGNGTIEKSWAPIGKFGYKLRTYWKWENIFDNELSQKDDWQAIKVGFFW